MVDGMGFCSSLCTYEQSVSAKYNKEMCYNIRLLDATLIMALVCWRRSELQYGITEADYKTNQLPKATSLAPHIDYSNDF